MTSPHPELPEDIDRCHALIAQLQAQLQTAREEIAQLQSAAAAARDAAAHIAHLETLLAQHQETIVEQQQTIENLAADNGLLKRCLFGSRRERFTDPAQAFLFDATTPDSPPPDEADQQPPEAQQKKSGFIWIQKTFPRSCATIRTCAGSSRRSAKRWKWSRCN
jgi:hypothetical protein